MRTLSLVLAVTSLGAVLSLGFTPAVAGTKATSTWVAPDLQPGTCRKVAVLARFSDDAARRILEDSVVAGLQKKGVEAVAAYQVLTEADLATEESIQAKAQTLGIDAGIVFEVTGQSTAAKSSPNVHASVGVPVRAGPFSVFLGTSVPLGGGSSAVRVVELKAALHAREAEGPRWIGTYSTDLSGGTERTAQDLARLVLKQLKKAGVYE
jgi:hypothetical protein